MPSNDPEASEATTQRGEQPDYTLACGGTEEDPHMVEMEFNSDAATPNWVCPECGSRSWVREVQEVRL